MPRHCRIIGLAVFVAVAFVGSIADHDPDVAPVVAGAAGMCSRDCPPSGPSDLRAIPLGGPALQAGYADSKTGLMIRLLSARTGRMTADDGCNLPEPQYYLYLRLRMTNSRTRTVTFDWVGVTVRDQAGHVSKPFGWSTYPSHPTRMSPRGSITAWISYSVGRLRTFSVRWANTFDPAAVLPDKPPYSIKVPQRTFHPKPIARYKVVATGVKACPA